MSEYLHRKCRECGKWTTDKQGSAKPVQKCIHCRAEFGRYVLGMDLIDKRAGDPTVDSVSPKRAEL